MALLQEERWPNAMAFYHPDGLKPAWDQATLFAGKDGHVATLPEIIEVRLATKPGDVPWEAYFTTRSAEYVGFDRDGKKKIVVAHGVGPMANLDGIMKAYAWHYKDKTGNHCGGRITREEFWKLLDGGYGDVHVVDYDEYVNRYQYPFLQQLRYLQVANDPLAKARLGNKAQEYLEMHLHEARKWHAEQADIDPENIYNLQNYEELLGRRKTMHLRMAGTYSNTPSNPYIVQLGDASHRYQFPIEEGMALAHLLSIGGLMHLHHIKDEDDGSCSYESLVFDIKAHGWLDGTRFVGVRKEEVLDIARGPDARELLLKNWQELMNPAGENFVGFRALMELPDGTWFTQYEKRGASLDTHEPEFRVESLEKIGDPTLFRVKALGYYGFFKYQIRDVEEIAPVGANAYLIIGEPELDGGYNFQKATIQFYRVEVDSTMRLKRQKNIENDFYLQMSLMINDQS